MPQGEQRPEKLAHRITHAGRDEFKPLGEHARNLFIAQREIQHRERSVNPLIVKLVRAIFLDKDQPVGEYSDIKVVTIAP